MLRQLKEFVARHLSSEQREQLKPFLRRAGLYSPRPEQIYLESLLNARQRVSIVQVGANDGRDFVRTGYPKLSKKAGCSSDSCRAAAVLFSRVTKELHWRSKY